MPEEMKTVECEKCGNSYSELRAIAEWKDSHPVRPLHCIQCDPFAEARSCVRVTDAGWDLDNVCTSRPITQTDT